MKNLEWCGHNWTTAMEGGRQIHTGQPWMWYDDNQVFPSSDGTLSLYAEYSPAIIKHWNNKVYEPDIATGLVRSVETFGYGRFSAEIMLPKGHGLWPSFWLIGSNGEWPEAGEIDIMEAWSNQLGYFRFSIPQFPYIIQCWKTTTNVHWKEYEEHCYTGSRSLPLVFSMKRPTKHFIKYEVDWQPDIITFYANGKRIRCYGADVANRLVDKRMHVIFNFWTTSSKFDNKTPMEIRNFEYKPIDII